MKFLVVIGLLLQASWAFGQNAHSQLSCLRGIPHVSVFLGYGPGCGESDSLGIDSVHLKIMSASMEVETFPIPGRGTDFCHYWGPIFAGGSLPHPMQHEPQVWTVSVDGDAFPGSFLLATSFVDGKVIPTCEVVR